MRFRSPVDGAEVCLTPEDSMDMQLALRSDIAMAFDDCTPYPATEAEARASMERSMRWAARSHAHYYRDGERPPGRPVRHRAGRHARARCAWPRSRRCCGSTGPASRSAASRSASPRRSGCAILEAVVPHMPADRPRYLMGVGRPEDIVAAVLRGIDMFDCVMPTRHARNGHLFTATGVINIRNAPTRPTSGRSTRPAAATPAATTRRAYLRHLDRCNEILGSRLNTIHNLHFYLELMRALRAAIGAGGLPPGPRRIPRRPARRRMLWHNAALFAAPEPTRHMNGLISDAWAQAAARRRPRRAVPVHPDDGGVHRASSTSC